MRGRHIKFATVLNDKIVRETSFDRVMKYIQSTLVL